MGLLKNCVRGFAGGPDFRYQRTLAFQLEATEIKITLPGSNIITEEPPRDINFPYRHKGWFEDNQKQSRQHFYVHLYTELWFYGSAVPISLSEYGMLGAALWLKRVPEGIHALDRQALATYVIAEHDQHYNSPTIGAPGEHALGLNTKIRKRMVDFALSRESPWSNEEIEEYVAAGIRNSGHMPIPPAKIISLQGREWVFYSEKRTPNDFTRQDYYCLPLDDRYYFQLQFNQRVDIAAKKAWQKHANKAQQKILETVRVTGLEA